MKFLIKKLEAIKEQNIKKREKASINNKNLFIEYNARINQLDDIINLINLINN